MAPRSWALAAIGLLLAAAIAEEEETCAAGGPCGKYYWPAQKGTPSRTGFSPHAVPDISRKPTWSWADPHEDTIRATPLIDDKSNIYLTTIAGRVYKFTAGGQLLWSRTMPFGMQVVAALHEGKLISATKSGEVVALDMETGGDVWKVQVSKVFRTAGDTASVFAYNGTVVSATLEQPTVGNDGNEVVVAVRAADGAELWRFKPPVNVYNFQASTPEDGTIVFQDRGGGLYRLGLDDGHEIWRSGRRGEPWSGTFTTGAAVCHEGKVFVTSNYEHCNYGAGLLHTYNLDDGKLLWEVKLAYPANQAVAVGPSPTDKSKSVAVVGFGANPGHPLIMQWFSYGQTISRAFHWLDLNLPWLFAKVPAAMAAYDPQTGSRLWQFDLPPYRAPATQGDSQRLIARYIRNNDGSNPNNDLICLPDSCSQPVVGPDGTAYQAWQSGMIYAIKDANGDGRIDPGEVAQHQLSDGFQGSLGLAPGLLAAAPCGGGLYVWRD